MPHQTESCKTTVHLHRSVSIERRTEARGQRDDSRWRVDTIGGMGYNQHSRKGLELQNARKHDV